MKQFLMLGFFMGLLCFGFSQEITVQDNSTKKPLEFATIVGVVTNNTVNTNGFGKANINSLQNDSIIEVRLLGYKSQRFTYLELKERAAPINLKVAVFDLDQVVVSATKWKQNKQNVAEKISVISRKDMALQNPQTAADLLNVSGEVFIQKSQQGGGSPMIRGFSTNRLLYTVDGVRMNTAIFRSGNLQNVISLDPFAMESTEILFGPGSIIYGSDAVGGIMSFQTLQPRLSVTDTVLIAGHGNVRASSANNERTYHFDINIGGKKWASVTSITSNRYGDLKMGSNGPNDYLRPFFADRIDGVDVVVENNDAQLQRPSAYTQLNLMQKLRYRASKQWNIEYGFHYSETSDFDRYDRHILLENGAPRYAEWLYGPQTWLMNALQLNHTKKTTSYDEMTVRLAIQNFGESRISRDFNSVNREIREENVDAYSANLDFRKKINRHELFYGVEAVLNKVDSEGRDENILTGITSNGASRYPQANWSSYAVYLNNQYTVTEKLNLQAGLRYNYFGLESNFDTTFYPFPFTNTKLANDAVTASLGLVYRPSENLVISGNVSTAFRSPNVDDVGKVFDSAPGLVVVPNPKLNAEYAYNAEIGIAKIFNNKLKLDLTTYYTILENALVRRNFRLNGLDSIVYDGELSQVQAIQNAARTYVFGVQAGVELKFGKGFSFTAHANFQQGEEELDNGDKSPSRHVAPFFGNANFQYQNKKLTLQLNGVYNGEISFNDLNVEEIEKAYLYAMDENGNPYSPEWYTLNLKGMYQFSKVISFSAGIENLTDQRYRPYSSGLAGAGRNYILSLNATF